MKNLARKAWAKIKRNPVRVLTVGLTALAAILPAIGVTDASVGEVIAEALVILGGGEKVRSKVKPVGR